MPDTPSKFHDLVELCDDLLALAKDFAIVVFVVLFLFFGPFLRRKLEALGIRAVGPIQIADVQHTNQQAKDAASNLALLETSLTDLESETSNTPVNNPEEMKWKNEIAALKNQASTADLSLKSTLLAQQALLQKASQTIDTSGWIYAGQVDSSTKKWSGVGAKNISPVPAAPDFQPGQTFLLSSDVFLHKTAPAGQWHTQGDVTAVLKQGEQVQVVGVDMSSPAKSGGYFVWLQIKQVS
jgi:hypothetical protein